MRVQMLLLPSYYKLISLLYGKPRGCHNKIINVEIFVSNFQRTIIKNMLFTKLFLCHVNWRNILSNSFNNIFTCMFIGCFGHVSVTCAKHRT